MEAAIDYAGNRLVYELSEMKKDLKRAADRDDPQLGEGVTDIFTGQKDELAEIKGTLQELVSEMKKSRKRKTRYRQPYNNVVVYFEPELANVTIHPQFDRTKPKKNVNLHDNAEWMKMPELNPMMFSVVGFGHADGDVKLLVETCTEQQAKDFIRKMFYLLHSAESEPETSWIARQPLHSRQTDWFNDERPKELSFADMPFEPTQCLGVYRSVAILSTLNVEVKDLCTGSYSLLCKDKGCEECEDRRKTKY